MRYRRAPRTAWRRLGDETVVLHLDRNTIFGLAEAGARVWEALSEEADLSAVCAKLGGEHAPELTAAALAQLCEVGLLEGPSPRARDGARAPSSGSSDAVKWCEQLGSASADTCLFLGWEDDSCKSAPARV